MYRKFWLINGRGNKYDLQNSDVFAHKPEGLGFSKTLNTLRLGDSEIVVDEVLNLDPYHFELLFFGSNPEMYQEYKQFLKFIALKPLELHYQTPDLVNESFSSLVTVTQVSKADVSPITGLLHCPIVVKPQNAWTSSVLQVATNRQEINEGKRYGLKRPYYYQGDTLTQITIRNDSNLDIPFLITIEGEMSNPTFSVYDEFNVLHGVAKFLGEFTRLEVDSNDLTENIELQREATVLINPTSYQDLSVGQPGIYLTFLKLKPGMNIITCNFTNQFNGDIAVYWRLKYV